MRAGGLGLQCLCTHMHKGAHICTPHTCTHVYTTHVRVHTYAHTVAGLQNTRAAQTSFEAHSSCLSSTYCVPGTARDLG